MSWLRRKLALFSLIGNLWNRNAHDVMKTHSTNLSICVIRVMNGTKGIPCQSEQPKRSPSASG